MSKVLISFLGTGPAQRNENNYREYSLAKYRFADEDVQESPFIAFALKRHYDIDRMILIGTPKSMWEEVYAKARGGEPDDVYFELAEFCENANYKTPPVSLPRQSELEAALGKGSKVVLINYGLTPKEINDNARKVLSVESFLNSNDEVYVDITHSFRSLPLMLMNTLIYLRNASSRNITIRAVSYGMLDVMREMEAEQGERFAPVVSLDSVLQMNEWISAASSFKDSLNAHKIALLMKSSPFANDCDKDVADKLVDLSNVFSMNYVSGVKQQLEILKNTNFKELSEYARITVVPVIKDLLKSLYGDFSDSELAFRLASFHFEKMSYSSAAICATECFVLYAGEKSGLNLTNSGSNNDKNAKQIAQDIIFGRKDKVEPKFLARFQKSFRDEEVKRAFCKEYKNLNEIRKQIAHVIKGGMTIEKMVGNINHALLFLKGNVF